MKPRPYYKGKIISEKSATCAWCECYLPGLQDNAAEELRDLYGWRQKRGIGWLCPGCLLEHAKGRPRG